MPEKWFDELLFSLMGLFMMSFLAGTPVRFSLMLILTGKAGRYTIPAVLFYWGAGQ